MKKETYQSQKAFAGEKKPSMKRRFVGHDYTKRGIYMLTMAVEGRLLMLSAWDHTNERVTLTASDCQQMNLMAIELSKLK